MPRLSTIPYWVLLFGTAFCLWHYSQDQFRRDFSFVLSNHLDDARSRLIFDNGIVLEGNKMPLPSHGVSYVGQPEWMGVSKRADVFNGVLDARIFLHPAGALTHEVTFQSLPTAAHLRLLYGFSDEARNNAPREGLGVEISVVDAQAQVLHKHAVAWTAGEPWQGGLQIAEIPLDENFRSAELPHALTISVRLTSSSSAHHHFYVDGYIW
jgi:hypothetical protein